MAAPARLDYDVVDVFAERPYAGNPLAVVHGSEGLGTGALQAIANEFNLSETAFPRPLDDGSYSVRIFTASTELPFAGHPTIGTAWVLHQRGEVGSRAVQHCGAGEIPVHAHGDGAELTADARSVSERLEPGPWLHALRLADGDATGWVRVASCGLAWAFLPVSRDRLARARLLDPSWSAAYESGDPLGGICVYAVGEGEDGVTVEARVFCPGAVGVPEDPATGSAAAALGLVLVADSMSEPDGETAYRVSQGAHVGRPSVLHGRVAARDGAAERVHVGGAVLAIATGSLLRPS